MMEKPELIYSRYPVTAVAMPAAALMLTMLSFSGCRHVVSKSSNPAVVNMITAASEAKDYARILSLADSLGKASQISPCVCTSTTHCRVRIMRAACLSPYSSDSSTCRRDTCRSAMPVTTHPFLEAAIMVATSLICFPMLPLG